MAGSKGWVTHKNMFQWRKWQRWTCESKSLQEHWRSVVGRVISEYRWMLLQILILFFFCAVSHPTLFSDGHWAYSRASHTTRQCDSEEGGNYWKNDYLKRWLCMHYGSCFGATPNYSRCVRLIQNFSLLLPIILKVYGVKKNLRIVKICGHTSCFFSIVFV